MYLDLHSIHFKKILVSFFFLTLQFLPHVKKSHERSDVISLGRSDVISHGRFYSNTTQSLNMEHVGTLAEAEDVLSPTIIAHYSAYSALPPNKKKRATFALKPLRKDSLWYSHCRVVDISPTPTASRHGHLHPTKNPLYTAPGEPPIRTKTPVFFAYKNTPKNSTAQSAAIRNSTQNAPQISQS